MIYSSIKELIYRLENNIPSLSVTTTGSGNAVTGISTTNNKLTVTKGSTFLKSITKAQVEGVLTGNISTHTHVGLSGWTDTRNVSTTPNDYSNTFKVLGIKTRSVINSPLEDGNNGTYITLAGIRGWNDNTGGNAWEFGFGRNNIYTRSGETSTWNTWKTISFDENTNTAVYFNTSSGTVNNDWYKISINSQELWMLYFKVRVYLGYDFYDIDFSGYNYGTNYWYQPKASLTSSSVNNINVKFGYDTVNKLWVAIPVNQYTGIQITDVTRGYNNISNLYIKDLFTITRQSTLTGTILKELTLYRPIKIGESFNSNITINSGVDTKLIFNNTDGENYSKISFREDNIEYAGIVANATSISFTGKPVSATSFVKSGGTGTLILMADGTTLNLTNFIQLSGGISLDKNYVNVVNAAGWYRICTYGYNDTRSCSVEFHLYRNYSNYSPESYTFLIENVYGNNVKITLLNGVYNIQCFDKIRVLTQNNKVSYIDIHYIGTLSNNIGAWGIGSNAIFQVPVLSNDIPSGYTSTEFEPVSGSKFNLLETTSLTAPTANISTLTAPTANISTLTALTINSNSICKNILIGSKADYEFCVILLCRIDYVNTNAFTRLNGKLYSQNYGSIRYSTADINFWYSVWNSGNDIVPSIRSDAYWSLITCTYNGILYYALKHAGGNAMTLYFMGTCENVLWEKIKYYDNGTRVTTNKEIYNSIKEIDAPFKINTRTLWGNNFDGTADVSGSLYLNNKSYIYMKDASGTNRTIIDLYASNYLPTFAYGFATAGYDVEYCGNNIKLSTGTTHTTNMIITNDGSIGIGTTSPTNKLHVVGNTYFNGNVGIGTNPSYKLDILGNVQIKGILNVSTYNTRNPAATTTTAPIHFNYNSTGLTNSDYTSLIKIDSPTGCWNIFESYNSNGLFFSQTSKPGHIKMWPGGEMHCDGLFRAATIEQTTSSDIRLKTNLEKTTNAIDKLNLLGDIYDFNYNEIAKEHLNQLDTSIKYTSLIYQNAINASIPGFCSKDASGYGYINFLSPSYQALLLATIKDLYNEIQELKSKT